MGWTPVSEHGINPEQPLEDVPAMAVAGQTLYAAGFDSGSPEREAELWSAQVGDERWRLRGVISGMHRPESINVHGAEKRRALYIAGFGTDGGAMLARFHPLLGMRALALPAMSTRLASLLSVGPYLFCTMDRKAGEVDARIWRTISPEVVESWQQVGGEIGAARRHIHSIKLGMGRAGEVLAGTARPTPGGPGEPGEGAEVWRGTDNGSHWERLAEDGFGDSNTGAIPALHSFRNVSGSTRIYASTQNHTAGNAIYTLYPGGRWGEIPYGVDPSGASSVPAPIRSMATFEGRLFIAEGNNLLGARLFHTMSGDGWTQDSVFGRPYDFGGSGGGYPLYLHALTPTSIRTGTRREAFLYLAASPYTGAEDIVSGAKIWRRNLDLWDSVTGSVLGQVGVPFSSGWRIS
jgi:hypothetical protein